MKTSDFLVFECSAYIILGFLFFLAVLALAASGHDSYEALFRGLLLLF